MLLFKILSGKYHFLFCIRKFQRTHSLDFGDRYWNRISNKFNEQVALGALSLRATMMDYSNSDMFLPLSAKNKTKRQSRTLSSSLGQIYTSLANNSGSSDHPGSTSPHITRTGAKELAEHFQLFLKWDTNHLPPEDLRKIILLQARARTWIARRCKFILAFP